MPKAAATKVEFHYPGQALQADRTTWLRYLMRHIIECIAARGWWSVECLDPNNEHYAQGFSHKQLYLATEPLAERRFESPQDALAWAWQHIGQRTR